MASENGHVSLSAVDFLGLIKQRKVVRLDLSTVGYTGVIYVRDLTAAEQAHVSSGSGKGARRGFTATSRMRWTWRRCRRRPGRAFWKRRW